MKNIVITPGRIRKELLFFLLSFIIAFGMNIYAIINYDTEWKEIVTAIPQLILLSFVLYFLIMILRLLYRGITRLFLRK